ncbi:MAG: RibD family protein, partial [Candidatus Eremiobacteraeota bacterium]|nr:RibD family protein [Candidatus Eremiobacteraeota bacterium]
EPFAIAIRSSRPYIALKMASSADGYIASRQGETQWLTGDDAREFVRELRFSHDAVMVGAGTIRVDDPLLTVRPSHDRARPYHRVIVCESTTVPSSARVFMPVAKYERTIVLAAAGRKMLFEPLQLVAEVLFVGKEEDTQLDLPSAMRALKERGMESVLCEGGPTLAARLLEQCCVDRVYWLTAPKKLGGPAAVPALAPSQSRILPSIDFERVEPLGEDMLLIGVVRDV